MVFARFLETSWEGQSSQNRCRRPSKKPWQKEGLTNGEWILLDYGNVVVHIFQKEIRDYYKIENYGEMLTLSLLKKLDKK